MNGTTPPMLQGALPACNGHQTDIASHHPKPPDIFEKPERTLPIGFDWSRHVGPQGESPKMPNGC
jgi:hypothetical protein